MPDLGLRQARPPREVLDRGRSVAGEVPAGELRKGRLFVESGLVRGPLLDQRVRLLPAPHRTARDEPLELGSHDGVGELVAGRRGQAGLGEHRADLGPGQPAPAPQGIDEHRNSALRHRLVEPMLAVVVLVERVHPRTGERLDPAQVGSRDEVPGRPQRVGAKDQSVIERPLHRRVVQAARPLPDRPLAEGILLRLHRAEPRHHRRRLGRGGAGQPLVTQAQPDYLVHVHHTTVRPGCDIASTGGAGRRRSTPQGRNLTFTGT